MILTHLYQNNFYLPQWLERDSLSQKIQKILEVLLSSQSTYSTTLEPNIENMKSIERVTSVSGQWCLVTVRQWRRETFLRYLDNDIQRDRLQETILEIIAPEESVYQDMILIRIGNFAEARNHLQRIDYFQSIQRCARAQFSYRPRRRHILLSTECLVLKRSHKISCNKQKLPPQTL